MLSLRLSSVVAIGASRNYVRTSVMPMPSTVMYAPTEMERENDSLKRELREAYVRIDTLNSTVIRQTQTIDELTKLLAECGSRLQNTCRTVV